ncbi:hypothetical protein PSEUBRA_003707 [Kalmanozyma brasiliensis GHG001]|uniref:uncharacterized protein n=1 Tax=Kalmanozyma brasiliensis (strain GHG001) TaxID=1365824 RepID=UPI0028680DD1|nr:uncharacterized protein PSEUBRA_003707 [Kalmanozyma brasiliensis GHG001]KAF6767275.1 hypothetical protein PSEUBRA_003707 [Kalmanozyma brasiliensis GHG001]
MAEKFSKFRDPGTGIQVFLTPVAASTSSSASGSAGSPGGIALLLTPIFVVLGLIRALIGGICWGLYLATGGAGLLRVVLFMLGFIRLPVDEVASGASGRRSVSGSKLRPTSAAKRTLGKGDLVLSNHSSWLDLLIISYLYPGIQFVLPVIADSAKVEAKRSEDSSTTTARKTPKKNAMSANTRIVTPSSASSTAASNEIPIVGYAALGLTRALRFVGGLPPCASQLSSSVVEKDLETTLRKADTPLALFPEVVTSNNRALLAFNILPQNPPPSISSIHILTLKYTLPSSTSTSSVYAVPGPTNSLTTHLLHILFLSNPVRGVSIRHSTLSSKDEGEGGWAEKVAGLMSSMARLKRTSIGWEAKREFLQMVVARGKRV